MVDVQELRVIKKKIMSLTNVDEVYELLKKYGNYVLPTSTTLSLRDFYWIRKNYRSLTNFIERKVELDQLGVEVAKFDK